MESRATEAEIAAFGEKLVAFGDGLEPGEQALLSRMLVLSSEEDTEGHTLPRSQPGQIPWLEMRGQVKRVVRQAAESSRGTAPRKSRI